MLPAIISFIVMLNPFALFLYLTPVMKDLTNREFYKVLTKATIISFLVYFVFALLGDALFDDILMIHFDSFRIFGGIVIFSFAYLYIVMGRKAMIQMKGNLDDLASEIALPFMVGAGTISLVILYRKEFKFFKGILIVFISLLINYFLVFFMKWLKDKITTERYRVAFDKNIGTLLRLNGFFVGAIGINMVIESLKTIFSEIIKAL